MTKFKRILLTRMKFVGDIVLTTPVVQSVRHAFPEAFIAYMGDRSAVQLLEQNPHLDEIIPFDYSRLSIMEQPRVVWQLRRRKFDLAIDMFGNPRSALLTYLSGAAMRVGLARPGRGKLYTLQVHDDATPKTAVEFHNQLIRAVGIEPVDSNPAIYLSDDERREARIYLRWLGFEDNPTDFSRPIVGIHPGASWPAKRWLPERFAAVADMLAAKLGAQIVISSGPKDDDAVREVNARMASNGKILRNLPLRQLAAIISHCDVFISNDAGPMHIAAAVGTATIGLFGPGEENIWFPYAREAGHIALRKNVPCHPCHLDFCNRAGDGYMECMKLLSVDEVLETARNIINSHTTKPPSSQGTY